MELPSGVGVAVTLIAVGVIILIPTMTLCSACGLIAQFIPLDCWASFALSFILAFIFIGLGIVIFLFEPREGL